jgi:predicted neuraminidase
VCHEKTAALLRDRSAGHRCRGWRSNLASQRFAVWGTVGESELLNPGSGLDGVRLKNGHWLLVYNDTLEGRSSLAVSVSDDEGRTWKWTRHLEKHDSGAYHYPAVIQGREGTIHLVYSYFVDGGKSMKHAAVNEAWIQQGEIE